MRHERIRDLLKTKFRDGASAYQLARETQTHKSINEEVRAVRRMLSGPHMPDVYIDRYGGNNVAIWMRADIPLDCPPPEGEVHGGRVKARER